MGKKTGGKGKKGSAQPRVLPGSLVVGVDVAREFLRLLNTQGDGLSANHRLAILNADGKGKAVANNRDPLFFDDLIPSNFRREGIWQRSLNAVVETEPTSAKPRRDVYSTPAGLTNLGNTCYANSALQVLFTNKLFREAIYNVEEEVVEGDASRMLSELRKLFLDMQFCDNAIADPRSFANMLKLQASEQQDAQEFQKLLMQRLEERLQRSAKPQIKLVLSNLYSGQSSYVTRCRRCRQESRMSSEVSEYFELDLQVKGVKSLAKSLQTLVAADALEGNNQYSCENCGSKQDADRQFCIRTLPPCLRINLQRFVFDWQSLTKQKCKDSISFPMNIDFTTFVHPVSGVTKSEQKMKYTLTAIILHRGSSASSGHYVSIVKDERLGVWWKYDDDSITKMGVHPFKGAKTDPACGDGEGSGASGAKKGAAKRKSVAKATKPPSKALTNGVSAKGKGAKGGMSTRAGRKTEVINIEQPCPAVQPECNSSAAIVVDVAPTADVGHRRKRSLADVSDSAAGKVADEAPASESRAGKRVCPAQPPVAEGCSPGDVQICSPGMPADQQSNGAVGGQMDVPDSKAAALPQDLTSKDAYMLIYTQAGYDCGSCVPEQDSEAALPAGTLAILQSMQEARAKADAEEAALQSSLKASVEERREHIKEVVNVIKPDLDDPEDAYFIDAEWLTKWANAPPNEEMPAISNSDLLCEHNRLDPLAWDSAKRVSGAAWGMLLDKWGGGPQLTQKDLCLECTTSQLEEIVQKEDTDVQRKNIAEQVKTCLEAPSDAGEFSPGMMLLSRKWIASWKARGCKLGYLSECMSPTASITCRHGKLLPAKTGKGSNRVAVTSDVFKFIRTHWRPANTQKPVVNTKRSSGGDKPGAGKEGDDVEMVAAASPGQPAGGEAEAVDVHSDAVADEDMNGPKGQENMPQNEAGQNAVEAMDVDDTVDGDKQAVDGDKPAAQEQALQGDEEDDDDDVIIAAPTEDGVTARVSGKEDRQMREFEAMHAEELECPECSELMSDTAQKEANLRKRVLEERNALRSLTGMQVLHLEHDEEYMLVPQMWLSSWRTWISGTPWKAGGGATAVGRGTESKSKPAENLMHLDEIMAEFCIKDEESGELKLLHELPIITQHRGKWTQKDNDSEVSMTIVECDQWELLKQYHGSDSTPDLSVRFVLEDAPVCAPPKAETEKQPDPQPSSPVEVEDSPSIVAVGAADEAEAGISKAFKDRAGVAPGANEQASVPAANAMQPPAMDSAERNGQYAERVSEPLEPPEAFMAPVTSPGPQTARGDSGSPDVLASSAAQFVQRHSPDKSVSADGGGVPVVPEVPGRDCTAPESQATRQQPAAAAPDLFPGFQKLTRGVSEQLQTPHLRQWNAESHIVAAAVGSGEAAAAPEALPSNGNVSAQPSDLSIIRAGLSTVASEPTTINISPASTLFGEGSLPPVSPAIPNMSPVLGPSRADVLASEPSAAAPGAAEQIKAQPQTPVVNAMAALPSGTAVLVAGDGDAALQPGGARNSQSGAEPSAMLEPAQSLQVTAANRLPQSGQQDGSAAVRADGDATCGNVDAAAGAQDSPQSVAQNHSRSIVQPRTQAAHPQLVPQRRVRTERLSNVDSDSANQGKKSVGKNADAKRSSTADKAAASKPQVRSSSRRRVSTQGASAPLVEPVPAPRTRLRRGVGSPGSVSDRDSQDPAQPSGAQEDVVDVDTAPQGGAAATWAVQKVGALHPSFTVCQDTIRQREMDRRSALLTFQDRPLLCQLVTYEQAVTDNVPVASSKRSRRGRVLMTTSHSATLRSLKLRLYSELDVHPMNMDCYVKGRLLESDDSNLQQLQVAYTDVINIVKVDRVPNDDYALLIEWQNMAGLDTGVVVAAKSSGAPLKERGFVDTLLAGGP